MFELNYNRRLRERVHQIKIREIFVVAVALIIVVVVAAILLRLYLFRLQYAIVDNDLIKIGFCVHLILFVCCLFADVFLLFFC